MRGIGHVVVALVAAVVTFIAGAVWVVVGPALWSQSFGGVREETVAFAGIPRQVLVYRPSNVPDRPGLVIDLHSSGANGFLEEATTRMTSLADQRGWIVAFPDAGDGGWNSYGQDSGVDDVAFLATVIDRLQINDHVDPDRVYVMGLSRGGMMAYRAACELSPRIAAIAVVEGNMADDHGDIAGVGCHPTQPVSIMAIHGSADSAVPLAGGDHFSPFPAVVGYWREVDGCAGTPSTTTGSPIMTTWSCRGGSQVSSIVVSGGHHAWPGAPLEGLPWTEARSWNASRVIADFFADHRHVPAA